MNKIRFDALNIYIVQELIIHLCKLAQTQKCNALKLLTGGYSFRSYTFDIQIFCNDDGRLLSNSYRSIIGISSYVARCDTAV